MENERMSYIDNIRKHAGKLTRLEIIFSQALEEFLSKQKD